MYRDFAALSHAPKAMKAQNVCTCCAEESAGGNCARAADGRAALGAGQADGHGAQELCLCHPGEALLTGLKRLGAGLRMCLACQRTWLRGSDRTDREPRMQDVPLCLSLLNSPCEWLNNTFRNQAGWSAV